VKLNKEQLDALSMVLEAAEIRQQQYAGIAEGDTPDDVISELWEVDEDEARNLASVYNAAIRVVRGMFP
jgi:hypothetical protein